MSAAIQLGTFVLAIFLFSPVVFGQASEKATAGGSCENCGQERWDVKTLSDPANKKVNFTPKTATVKQLYSMAAPASGATRNPAERKTYTVHAKLVGYKIEFHPTEKDPEDRDFHIVIQDMNGPQTMVVEIPDPHARGHARL